MCVLFALYMRAHVFSVWLFNVFHMQVYVYIHTVVSLYISVHAYDLYV